ncbi:MAG: serine/threonine protein kinase, partial [Deltaproteobacteria bacterium]|nr:serine/threonine protein kinase [Deltaproteobacteria bacterium]MBW2533270.1 serine/threonine protein kinase [Deltaproteobacteria bacterium]
MLGSTIDGKYEVQRLLGEGGMGSVYEASHTTTGRRCAVKVISSEGLTKDPNVVGRFQREARASGVVDTQYIAQVLDAGVDRDSGLPFMVVEYLDGEDLQNLLKRVGPLSPELVLRIAAQGCLGLQKAHEAKVVHRDIKPANLFLTKRDAEVIVKVLDFGIAKVKMEAAHSAEGADLTKTGNLLGSPMYMSPEQARGQRRIDHRTDIYSLGAVMYQCLSGRTPYQHATALGELILFVCSEPAPPLQDHAPWVPAEIAAIVHRCLEKSPDARFQSAQELFDELTGMLPDGYTLTEGSLVGIADAERQAQAARLSLSEPPGSGDEPPAVAEPPPAPEPPTVDMAGAAAVDEQAAATTGAAGAMAATQVPAEPKSRTGLIVGGALAVAALGGGGVYFATKGPAAETTPAAIPTTAAS